MKNFWDEYKAAERYLRAHAKFDFDQFERETTPENLFEKPLGPTPECLSIDEIAAFVSRDQIPRASRTRQIKSHLSVCQECILNLSVYQKVEMRNRRLRNARARGARHDFIVDPVCHVEKSGEIDILFLSNTEPSLAAINPSSVVLCGIVSAHGCTFEPLNDPKTYGVRSGVWAHFHPQWPSFDEICRAGSFPRDFALCDLITLQGEWKSGEPFARRSFVRFEVGKGLRSGIPRRDEQRIGSNR